MKKADRDYYRTRQAEEEAAAHRAGHPAAARSHKDLAERYAGLASSEEDDLEETAGRE